MSNNKQYKTDPKLREALKEYRTKHELTNSRFAKILGVSETFFIKYINDKMDRPLKNFEPDAWDAIKTLNRRIEMERELFTTSVTKNVHGRINFIRKTGDIGIVHSKAGMGKTSAFLLYIEQNPSAVYASLNARTRMAKQVEGCIFNAIEHREWKGCSSRFDFLVNHLKGSLRPLLIDNGQRLLGDGLDWIFDFHDATGCPVIIGGNPDIVDKVQNSDQRSSRLGIISEVKLTESEIARCSKRVATQFSDEKTADEIEDLVAIIAKHDGYLRSVRKEVMLMQAIRKHNPSVRDDPRRALRMAHKELVRNYDLPV